MTLIEVLVVMGLLLVLMGFAINSLSQSKTAAMATAGLSDIRQFSLGLHSYASANRDLPPLFGEPDWPPRRAWQLDFGNEGTGNWFEQTWLSSYALTAELGSTEVANSPGRPEPWTVVSFRGQPASRSDYLLSATLYAHPQFFDWQTRRGVTQFRGQQLAQISYPSDKGTLRQNHLFNYPAYGPVPACCVVDLPSPVAFADHSASLLVLRRLPRGPFNIYAPNAVPPQLDPRTIDGEPVTDTLHGVRGRDKL